MNNNTWKQFKTTTLSDKKVATEYKKLAPEFALAEKLISLRLAQNISQKELASRSGLKQSAIARLESGTTNPRLTTIYKVSKALGKELELV